jgi:hypothetical protein
MPRSRESLTKAVEIYLELAALHPEKEPKTQHAQRDNQMIIIGFNQSQEALRNILDQTGHKKLAETRGEGQQQPMKMGNSRLWVAL